MDKYKPYEKISSKEIEMYVIGSIFSDEQALVYVMNQLEEIDFTDEIYKTIFSISKEEYDSNKELDKYSIHSEVKRKGYKDSDKYINYINKAINFSNPNKIQDYCTTLLGLTFRRELYKSSEKLMMKANNLNVPESELINETEKIKESQFRSNPEVAKTSQQIKDSEVDVPQLKTGIKILDEVFYRDGGRGLGTTELVFARPGHGKTFYLFMKESFFAKQGYKWLHFHLEDTDLEASRRIDANIHPYHQEEFNKNILVISEHRYLHNIMKDIRYYAHKYGIKGFTIDHLGRVQVSGFRADQKVPAMIEASNNLTDLSKFLKLHGIMSVQPNKSYKLRKGYDNMLREEDLKGATEIFEDPFVVTTLFRPNIYPELRKGSGVMSPYSSDDIIDYDSVLMTQIKNRRQRITDNFLHLVQDGNRLKIDHHSEISQRLMKVSADETETTIENKAPF